VAGATELPDDLDVGYRVLLDKDDAAVGWAAPTFSAHVPAKPSSAVYEALVEEFWWVTTYVAKALRRGELVFARGALDCDAKANALRRMLEWRIELDQDWGLRPSAYGRGLDRPVPSDVWAELSETYGGVDAEVTWEALFRTGALFRRVAAEVGDALGYAYPQRVDQAMTSQLEAVRQAAQLR
jgi:aminoglycoside 6-adenylyltransferase